MGLDGVGDLAINLILSKVGPKEIISVGCLGKRFNEWASEDTLWSKICSDELQLLSPIDPFQNPCPNFKATYQAWREAFRMYPWPLVRRVKRCWDRLKTWLSINFPEALATLRRGASEDDINELETSLKLKLPLPTRVLYRFCDGQELTYEDSDGNLIGSPLGIIGGYSFYDNLVNVYLLPLNRVIREAKAIGNDHHFNAQSKFIVVACSSTASFKFFSFNCANGQLYVGTQNLISDGEMMPCVPKDLISSGDGMLLWLEEHVRRLENGIIGMRGEGESKTINLFPEEDPLCSTAVTNGVKVRASAVFVPEGSDLQDETHKYFFSYSIRMSLLPEGCNIHGRSFDSCQLYWRHWIIRADDTVIQDFNGKAVIGQYPLLHRGEKEFIYQSCSTQKTSSGSIEGSFTFFPGRSRWHECIQLPQQLIREAEEQKTFPTVKMKKRETETKTEAWHQRIVNINSKGICFEVIGDAIVKNWDYIWAEGTDQKKKRMKTDSDISRLNQSMRNHLDALASLKGEQVAARVTQENDEKDEWFVVKVIHFDRETREFEVLDEDPGDDEEGGVQRKYKLSMSYIIPFPKRNDPTSAQDFLPGKQVLAVYPGTTALYKATVVHPRKRKTDDYVLEFDDDEEEDGSLPQRVVPFHRVVGLPEGHRQ